jgi:hypothetical protein
MIFHRLILVLFAVLAGCVYSAPISAHLSSNVDSNLELFAPRVNHPATFKRLKLSLKHAVQAIKIKNKISELFNPGPSKSVFWSGVFRNSKGRMTSVGPTAQKYAKQYDKKTINHALRDAEITIPPIQKNPYSTDIWDHASSEWAKKAHGKVEVVVGAQVRHDSVYNRIEKPTLMENKAVTEVVEWNAQTKKTTKIKP